MRMYEILFEVFGFKIAYWIWLCQMWLHVRRKLGLSSKCNYNGIHATEFGHIFFPAHCIYNFPFCSVNQVVQLKACWVRWWPTAGTDGTTCVIVNPNSLRAATASSCISLAQIGCLVSGTRGIRHGSRYVVWGLQLCGILGSLRFCIGSGAMNVLGTTSARNIGP